MKNFPHQVNRVEKLRASLETARELIHSERGTLDDADFGYSCAESGIYEFRDVPRAAPTDAIRARIEIERRKPPSNQGPRAFARDLKRTLLLLGFVGRQDASYVLTEVGQRILDLPPRLDDEEVRALWTHALLRLDLGGSHPVRIILRIVQDRPRLERKWLALALEAEDDSPKEYGRICRLLDLPDFDLARRRTGAPESHAKNAVKILPSLMEQVGLISIDGSRCSISADGVERLVQAPPRTLPSRRRGREAIMHRRPSEGTGIRAAADIRVTRTAMTRSRDPEAALRGYLRLSERTERHQGVLRRFVSLIRNVEHLLISEDAFDLICEAPPEKRVLLVEVKTVEGDGLLQARAALGQLLFYEYFDVRPRWREWKILRIAVFDNEPGGDARSFLAAHDIEVVVLLADAVLRDESLARYLP